MIRCELLDLSRKYRRELAARITNRPDAQGKQPVEHAGHLAARADGAIEVEKWGRLQEAVEQLPEDESRVIELRCFGHWSRQETAVLLGIDEKTVTRRYGRAIEKLGQTLKGFSFE